MPFGQWVIGPPGSGKSTYCVGLEQLFTALGRKCAFVNLDPANDAVPYQCSIDVRDIIKMEKIMEEKRVGPNGGAYEYGDGGDSAAFIIAMEMLQEKKQWLVDRLKCLQDAYVVFDCPGQVELYTHHTAMQSILTILKKSGYNLTAVHLVDCHVCAEPRFYVSAVIVSLCAMLHLELPHVNVLSKMDLFEIHGDMPFDVDFYLDVPDIERIVSVEQDAEIADKDPTISKSIELVRVLSSVINDFGLVAFHPLDVQSKDAMIKLLSVIDKANGHSFVQLKEAPMYTDSVFSVSSKYSEFGDNLADEYEFKRVRVDDEADRPEPSDAHRSADRVPESADRVPESADRVPESVGRMPMLHVIEHWP